MCAHLAAVQPLEPELDGTSAAAFLDHIVRENTTCDRRGPDFRAFLTMGVSAGTAGDRPIRSYALAGGMMARYTQDNRPVRVDSVLGPDVLLLDSCHGVDSVSMPFNFSIDLFSEKPDVDARALLRTPMRLTFAQSSGAQPRYVHGLVRRFVQLGQQDDLTLYRADVVPWLWFLSLSRECRIHQNLNVLDIIEKVFRDAGWSDFEMRCKRPPPVREYCVQYRETHLDFVSRLMEEEGILYFFEHTDEKHLLVLTDDSLGANPLTNPDVRFHPQRLQEEDIIWALEREHCVHTGAVTLRDYDYLQPSLTLENALTGDYPEEIYDYPGDYRTPGDGDQYVRFQLEALEAEHQTLRGESNCYAFTTGHKFKLNAHYRTDTNGEYFLTRVEHFVQGSDYHTLGKETRMEYNNTFTAIPANVPYRPPRRTRRPIIHGTQTALVVGPAGDEVHVDRHCRVKLQFYWDREGKKDENSSCWVRVTTPLGGKGYGSVSIPRIGNEVVVEFIEGNPDRPLIVGSVYNAEQAPPFALPGSGIQMGMKSRSSPAGGGYNEITMTDTKGKEAMTLHAQYNMDTTVENDQTSTINNNRTSSVAVDDTESVGSNQAVDVGADQTITVGANQSVSVGADRDLTVAGNEAISVGANQDTAVAANRSVQTGVDDSVEAGTSINRKAGVAINLEAGAHLGGKAGATAMVEAPTITIKGSIVQVGDGAITIQGSAITLSAGGSSIAITGGGIVLSGPSITSAASGMNKVMGGVVMIN